MVNIINFDNISSTNKYALEHIEDIEADSVVIAKTQDAGRGRFSRKWISDKEGNCYMSFILKPNIAYRNNFPNLTQYLSVVLCRELKKYSIKPSIKWPNDVQVNGKKIAGILSEVAFSANKFGGIVLGIGVNLNLDEEDLNRIDIPATSLNIETKRHIDNNKFIKEFIDNFFKCYDDVLKNGFISIRAEYLSYCNFLGKEITIKNPEPTNLGTAIGIDNDGSLEIITPHGETQKIISGDVCLNQ